MQQGSCADMQLAAGSNTTTTTTEIWQWQCAVCRADWKMLRQVTTTRCPHGHGCRCCHATPPPFAGNHPLPPHHHHHPHGHHLPQEEGTSWALVADEGSESKNAGTKRNTTATLSPAPPAVAQVCWVPDPYLMVQQLMEFEPLNDEVVALRVQLQEYAEEIERSISRRDGGGGGAGTDWFLALPASVRDVLVMARDAIESFIAMSTTAPAN